MLSSSGRGNITVLSGSSQDRSTSIGHLLITEVILECGYPARSIRERIYGIPDVGYAVLLYTGSSDAEGILGGLVQVGRRVHDMSEAPSTGLLCSKDPVCAQHDPRSLGERSICGTRRRPITEPSGGNFDSSDDVPLDCVL